MTSPAWARLREAAEMLLPYLPVGATHGLVPAFTFAEIREALAAVDAEPQQPDEARERAIAEWEEYANRVLGLDLTSNEFHRHVVSWAKKMMRSAPAQQPVPEKPKPCEFCNGSLKDGTEGHGLGECVPVCPTCDGSGSAKPPATSSWLHELAFLGFDPQGCMTYRVNRFGDGAAGNPAFHLDFADLQRALRLQLAVPEEPKPASPASDCQPQPFSSRRCERGTEMCDVKHEKPASDWRERFMAQHKAARENKSKMLKHEYPRGFTPHTVDFADDVICALTTLHDGLAALEARVAKLEGPV